MIQSVSVEKKRGAANQLCPQVPLENGDFLSRRHNGLARIHHFANFHGDAPVW